MIEAAEQALANFQHEQALAQAHARRADGYLAQFLSLVGQKAGASPTGQTIRCVREWTRWLADNGPALKATVQEGTGVKFTERGMPHTFLWDESMDPEDDDAYPPMAIMRIQGPRNDGSGRPPMVYFLWSQRWDVHPLFGVGPVMDAKQALFDRGTLSDGERQALASIADAYGSVAAEGTPPSREAVLGVIRPPVSSHPIDPANGEEVPINWDDPALEPPVTPAAWADDPEPEPEHARCATMEEWDTLHAAFFDAMVASESKPSEGQKDFLRATLPVDAEPNAAIAIAYRQAVERSRQ